MIISEIFKIENCKNLTGNTIEQFLEEKNIKAVKWSVIEFTEDFAKILVSFEKFQKKTL